MKIVTWNINSLRARQERVVDWLSRHAPDVVCLQEVKVVDEDFPHDALLAAGYRAVSHGQKTYNGVAILAREEPTDVVCGFWPEDPQARLIGATVNGVRIYSAYFPNGRSVDHQDFGYKKEWMSRLLAFLAERHRPEESVVLAGDFNVAWDDRDARNVEQWADSTLCHEDVRGLLQEFVHWGFVDLFRQVHPEGGVYSWWDYRRLAFPKNDGLRIDYLFGTASVAERLSEATIDRDERKKGTIDKPSDHAPVIVTLD